MIKYPERGYCYPDKDDEVDMVYCDHCEMECKYRPKKEVKE